MGPAADALRQFWNARFEPEAHAYGTEPNTFPGDALSRFGPLPAGAA